MSYETNTDLINPVKPTHPQPQVTRVASVGYAESTEAHKQIATPSEKAANRMPTPRHAHLAKVVFDRVAAAMALIGLAPLFLYLMYKVRQDGGPAFYAQTRVGQNGKVFRCWKFRSMIINAEEVLKTLLANDPAAREEYARDFKLKNDPRITKVGHLLRKTSLDELPQLFNVLMGEMSLVGPRPVTSKETALYGEHLADYLSVKPGMTGLWQISGRNDVTYEERVRLDSTYVNNWSFWQDIVIMLKTVGVVFNRSGAY